VLIFDELKKIILVVMADKKRLRYLSSIVRYCAEDDTNFTYRLSDDEETAFLESYFLKFYFVTPQSLREISSFSDITDIYLDERLPQEQYNYLFNAKNKYVPIRAIDRSGFTAMWRSKDNEPF
jgi:hypothetical protein